MSQMTSFLEEWLTERYVSLMFQMKTVLSLLDHVSFATVPSGALENITPNKDEHSLQSGPIGSCVPLLKYAKYNALGRPLLASLAALLTKPYLPDHLVKLSTKAFLCR